MTTLDIVSVIFGSGISSTFFIKILDYFQDKKHQSFLVLQLAFMFEKYVIDCVSMLSDDHDFDVSDGHVGVRLDKILEFPTLPEDKNYIELDQKLLSDIFEFPQRIQILAKKISTLFEIEDGEYAQETHRKGVVELALKALSIASRLRKKYSLPERSLEKKVFNYEEFLRKELESNNNEK